jgi:hypothetical protein
VLDDPYADPAGLDVPSKSPPPVIDAHKGMLPETINLKIDQEMTAEDQEKRKKELEKQQVRMEDNFFCFAFVFIFLRFAVVEFSLAGSFSCADSGGVGRYTRCRHQAAR